MHQSIYYRKYKFLMESIDKNQEENLKNQFLEKFKLMIDNNNNLELKLLDTLNKLNQKDQFHIQFINREEVSDELISNAYGYFSAYENCIYLIVDKDDFERKWLGFFIDYNNFSDKSIQNFITTCMHELMHFICTNYYNSFKKIWSNVVKEHIHYVFTFLVKNFFYDFVDKETFQNESPKLFLNDPEFKKIIDVYYNSISINTRFRYKSSLKKYHDILSNLYSKHHFKYARFIDNVLINVMKLREGTYGKCTNELYFAIKNAYLHLEPSLSNVNFNILFYQELLDFSEIPCVLATYYKYIKKYISYIDRTLNLI